jgi:hypothetical protein
MASQLDSNTTVVAMLEANTINGGSSAITTKLVKSQLDFCFVLSNGPIPPTAEFFARPSS